MYLGNSSKGTKVRNLKKTELKGYVYGFCVDYNTIDISDIVNILKYSMKEHKHDTQLCSRVLNKLLFCYKVLANHQLQNVYF